MFDGKGSLSFGNEFAKNVIMLGVDNSSSSHAENLRNYFLILGEGDTFGVNRSFSAPEKNIDINFSKAKTKFYLNFALQFALNFCLGLHYNSGSSYLSVNGK